MIRFFVTPQDIDNGRVIFSADDSHHIANVLKMRAGEQLAIVPGDGSVHVVTMDTINKTRSEGRIFETTHPITEPFIKITVAQAVPKTIDKLEWVLQHGTEIGVTDFLLFNSARSRPDADRLKNKLDRWRQIIKTAAEQCGRVRLPTLTGILGFREMLTAIGPAQMRLMPWEGESMTSLRDALGEKRPESVAVIIGPEGGFADSEVKQARNAGAEVLTLGPRILRTETAALSVVSQILYAFDADTPRRQSSTNMKRMKQR